MSNYARQRASADSDLSNWLIIEPVVPFYRRPISAKTILLVLLTPVVAVSVPALLWLAWGARPLNPIAEYNITTPSVPSPNAYHLHEEAEREVRAQTRYPYPALILNILNPQGTTVEDPKKYPLSGKIQWLNRNQSSFEKFERALKMPYYFPPIRDPQTAEERTYSGSLNRLARYLTVQCEVWAAQGRSEQAVQRALDIWQMGLDAGHGTPIGPALRAVAVEAYARRTLDSEIAHLNGAQAARAARRMEKLVVTREPWKEIVQEERNVGLLQMKPRLEKAIHSQRRQKEWEAALARGETDYKYDPSPAPQLRGPIINWMVRRKSDAYARGVAPLVDDAETPWPMRQTTPPSGLDEPTTKLVAVVQKGRFFIDRAEAMAQITLARLALHAYRKDKGVYPPTLEALAPTYLAKVPLDPFSNRQPLRYRRDGKRYKLWSLGPDARDDNARPAINPSPRTPEGHYMVVADATGDIVANVSR